MRQPELVRKHHVSGIIITAILSLELEIAVRRFAREHRVRLSEWRFEEKNIDLGLSAVLRMVEKGRERTAIAAREVIASSG